MTSFQFPYYDEDFIEKFQRDYGDQISPELKKVLADYASTQASRDEDLEAFLDSDSYAPAIGVERGVVQSIPDASWTSITFDSQEFISTDLISWDNATKLTIGENGIINMNGDVTFALNVTGERFVRLFINNTTQSAIIGPLHSSANAVGVGISKATAVVAGDYVELQAFQSSGGNLNANASLSIQWLGKSG